MQIIEIDSEVVELSVTKNEFNNFMIDSSKLFEMVNGGSVFEYKKDMFIEKYLFMGTFPLLMDADIEFNQYTINLSYDYYYNVVHAYLTGTHDTTQYIADALEYTSAREIVDWYNNPNFRRWATMEKLKSLLVIAKENKIIIDINHIIDKVSTLYLMDMIKDTVRIGRTVDTNQWAPSDVISKLAEETGELARAVQIKNGKLPSKTQEDGEEIRECADVINCAIDAISQVNRNLTDGELIFELLIAMSSKNKKWESVMFKKE